MVPVVPRTRVRVAQSLVRVRHDTEALLGKLRRKRGAVMRRRGRMHSAACQRAFCLSSVAVAHLSGCHLAASMRYACVISRCVAASVTPSTR